MFRHLAKTALNKLADRLEASISNSGLINEPALQTLHFPPPPPHGPGTNRLCPQCLTLLYHVAFAYGDGSRCAELEMPHVSSMASLISNTCVICVRNELLFNGMRQHVSFEPTLRQSPSHEWRLTWKLDTPTWHAFHKQAARVSFMVKHKGGYSWGIGYFILHPSPSTPIPSLPPSDRKPLPPDPHGTILPLNSPSPAFNSTLSSETLSAVASWMQTCHSSHKKCAELFPAPALVQNQSQRSQNWFPDRLIRITRTDNPDPNHWLHTRLVLKSKPSDFPPNSLAAEIQYLSFSHCWGPPPPGGRGASTLTSSSLAAWQENLPLAGLPRAFRDAVRVCAALGFDHLWIDSLCIMQDSVADWQAQSAVMADVYKYAWLNIAALSTESDEEGFVREVAGGGGCGGLSLTQGREPRVVFGWRAELGGILGVSGQGNHQGSYGTQQPPKYLVLLEGETTLLWNIQHDLPGAGSWQAPLFTRAWVHQERSLARRTLGFATHGVFFACDEGSCGENLDILPGLSSRGYGPRHMRHEMTEMVEKLSAEALVIYQAPTRERMQEEAKSMVRLFGSTWGGAVVGYTECKLTKATDRLIAISSIAREMANSNILKGKRYLAGLWDLSLVFQLGWMTCEGRLTAPRKRVGSEEYVAPSWSWASIEAPVVTSFNLCPDETRWRALAEVRGAEVKLATDFAFGAVTAGWMRLRGCLRGVTASETKPNYDYERSSVSTSLTDATTGEKFWCSSDTVEGLDIIASRASLGRVVWMPHLLHVHEGMVECKTLVFEEVGAGESFGGGDFVRPGEKVYRRIGTGNFGRVPDLFRQDSLLMSLGTFPVGDDTDLFARGFIRDETWDREFVVI